VIPICGVKRNTEIKSTSYRIGETDSDDLPILTYKGSTKARGLFGDSVLVSVEKLIQNCSTLIRGLPFSCRPSYGQQNWLFTDYFSHCRHPVLKATKPMVADSAVVTCWLSQISLSIGGPSTRTMLEIRRRRSHRKLWRSVWRICCSQRGRGRLVQLRSSQMTRNSASYRTNAWSFHRRDDSDSMAADNRADSQSSRPAASPLHAQPDFDDSSLDSWESGRYVPPPPFVPLYKRYREQTMAHPSAYSRNLMRGTATRLSGDYYVYSKP